VVTQEAQLGAQAVHFIEQIKHGLEHGQVDVVNGTQMLDSPYGMDCFFREFHHSVRRLNDWSHQAGTAIDQKGTAGDSREISGGIEAVEDVRVWLKQLQSNG
jgi:hypothetical protein